MTHKGKSGSIVPVYQKPLTEEDMEGEAKLEKFIRVIDEINGRQLEEWQVNFATQVGSPDRAVRTILF